MNMNDSGNSLGDIAEFSDDEDDTMLGGKDVLAIKNVVCLYGDDIIYVNIYKYIHPHIQPYICEVFGLSNNKNYNKNN